MRTLTVFNHISLDGYFTGEKGDLKWVHRADNDPEWESFVQENAGGGGELVFGRITYDMMAGWWPSEQAAKADPVVAERMNSLPKVVFSKSMDRAAWKNTRLLKGDLAAEAKKLKEESGPGLVIMGSGKIVSQLAAARLIDEYQFVVNPIVLGKGRTLFEDAKDAQRLRRLETREFRNGNLFVRYAMA